MKQPFKTDREIMQEKIAEKELRDAWQTPPQFMRAIVNCFGIHKNAIDVCASKENAQFENYFDEEMDALSLDWVASARDAKCALQFWCNPGYSNVLPWVNACAEAVRDDNDDAVAYLLTHDNYNSEWFRKVTGVIECKATYLLQPRIPFIPAPGIKASTPRGNNMLHVFEREAKLNSDYAILTLEWKEYL